MSLFAATRLSGAHRYGFPQYVLDSRPGVLCLRAVMRRRSLADAASFDSVPWARVNAIKTGLGIGVVATGVFTPLLAVRRQADRKHISVGAGFDVSEDASPICTHCLPLPPSTSLARRALFPVQTSRSAPGQHVSVSLGEGTAARCSGRMTPQLVTKSLISTLH